MAVLHNIIDRYRLLRDKIAEEIRLIDTGKLAIVRGGYERSQAWADELRDRLKKIDAVLAASTSIEPESAMSKQ